MCQATCHRPNPLERITLRLLMCNEPHNIVTIRSIKDFISDHSMILVHFIRQEVIFRLRPKTVCSGKFCTFQISALNKDISSSSLIKNPPYDAAEDVEAYRTLLLELPNKSVLV